MKTIRYEVVESIVGIPLVHEHFQGFMMGGFKTVLASTVAEHAILYKPSIQSLKDTVPLVRINSACFTGDIFGDRRCDCNEQLIEALKMIEKEGGLVIYHFHHEGRGVGFTSKLRTYQMMEDPSVNTFEAMNTLTNRMDLRNYGSAVLILQNLGIRRLQLITNNPNKRLVLEENGIEVVSTRKVVINRPAIKKYLVTKQEIQGHSMDIDIPLVKGEAA